LPDFKSADYLLQASSWRFLEDVYRGDRAWADYQEDGSKKPNKRSRLYLPQELGEDDSEYAYRFQNSSFSDKFGQAVRDYVGLVFNNGLRLLDVPPQILSAWTNLDGNGLNGNRLLATLALKALRRGHTFSLIDFPALDESIRSLADQQGRYPFWSDISPLQVLNWRFYQQGQRQMLSQVSIQVDRFSSVGRYGEQRETRFLTLQPGYFEVHVISSDRNRRRSAELLENGPMGRRRNGRLIPFDHIPFRCIYGGDRQGFFTSNPTLLTLADLNIEHYQIKSDHRQKMHRCCFPQAVRVGGQGEDLILGPGTIVDVPIGGAFAWAEPRADSLDRSRQQLLDIEAAMDFLGIDYVVKPSDRQAAATTEVQAAKVESKLYLFASDFAQGVTECLSDHAAYLGLPSGGRVELNTKFFERTGSDPQLLQVYLQMKQEGVLDRTQLLRLARDRNFIPATFDVDGASKNGETIETG
jgi:hypothetical protein